MEILEAGTALDCSCLIVSLLSIASVTIVSVGPSSIALVYTWLHVLSQTRSLKIPQGEYRM